MEQYIPIREVGSGSYGNVWLAFDQKNDSFVAVKKLKRKYDSLDECRNLREVKSLRKMNNHPNIVKLKNLVKVYDTVYVVFEYMESDLRQHMKQRRNVFDEDEVRNLCFQILQGLHYMHQQGYFHRDLKPENLLVSKDVIKIGDLGMAKEIDFSLPRTDNVTSRWYRAPEVLLRSKIYGPKVDMWAMGAIMAELLSFRILFPGKSSVDQIKKICQVIGSPTEGSWPDGIQLARNLKWEFPQMGGVSLAELIPSASKDAISLISKLCSWSPCRRPTAEAALQHPFFGSCYCVPPSVSPYSNQDAYIDPMCRCLKCEMKRADESQFKLWPPMW